MGQAKQRGTFEQRRMAAARAQLLLPFKKRRLRIAYTCCNLCSARHRYKLTARLHYWWLWVCKGAFR